MAANLGNRVMSELPREVMESCLAVSQEQTFAGFSESVLKDQITRLHETMFRMGFENGWRARESAPSQAKSEAQSETLAELVSELPPEAQRDVRERSKRHLFEMSMNRLHPEWAFTNDPVFGYHNERTRCAWEGWQAALSSREQLIGELVEALEASSTELETWIRRSSRGQVRASEIPAYQTALAVLAKAKEQA